MSNKTKSHHQPQQTSSGGSASAAAASGIPSSAALQQQHHHHHHHQPQQQQQHQGAPVSGLKPPGEPVPPRYQPPPQPGILKSAAVAALSHQQQLHQLHQQQAARLASQVKDAVQSKFAHKSQLQHPSAINHHHHHQQHQVDLHHPPSSAQQQSQQQSNNTRAEKLHGLHPGKSYIPTGIPTLSGAPAPAQAPNGAGGSSSSGTSSSNAVPSLTNGLHQQPTQLPIPGSLPPPPPPQQQQQQQQQQVQQQQQQQSGALPQPRQRISDDEFLRLGPVEMLKFVRKTETDIARLAAEQHRQIQTLVNEIRALKEANQRLSDDNQELRDLCCFLDDDRQKGRKLAREWQRFGRYTASVMHQEVSAYQNKLRQLDNKQQELIKDNLELKELCLYLDEERGGGQRDDGDGSSSSTNADETAPAPPRLTRHVSSAFNDQTMQYVRSLEQRIKQLEEDKSILQARAQGWPQNAPPQTDTWDSPRSPGDDFHLGSRPEAVVRALQVLEVREQLEREAGHDGEKALVREMCNVVWRKLEEGPMQNRH